MVIPPASHPTASLLQAAQSGDPGAFDRLFARLAPRLRWYVGMRLGPQLRQSVEPEDVLQETFSAAWKGLGGFEDRGPGSLLRWFFALAENRLKTMASASRAQRRDRRRTVAGGPADAALALEADPRTGPCTRAGRIELRLRIAAAVDELPADERAAILARVIDGRPLADVAQQLGRSESAVRRLVAKAAANLGRLLDGEGQA